jgi:hypothetical protein
VDLEKAYSGKVYQKDKEKSETFETAKNLWIHSINRNKSAVLDYVVLYNLQCIMLSSSHTSNRKQWHVICIYIDAKNIRPKPNGLQKRQHISIKMELHNAGGKCNKFSGSNHFENSNMKENGFLLGA